VKKIIIIICIIIWSSCQNTYKKPSFFLNMTKRTEFNSVKDKQCLKGFDRIILNATDKKIQNVPCWLLSTPENGNFDIEGLIWLRDSIVYIKSKQDKQINANNNQILFNFGKVDTTWIVNYSRGEGFPPYLEVRKVASHYNSDIKEKTTLFSVQQHLKNCSWIVNEFYVEVSIKYGFVGIVYSDHDYKYIIEFLPTPKLSKKPPKVYHNKLE